MDAPIEYLTGDQSEYVYDEENRLAQSKQGEDYIICLTSVSFTGSAGGNACEIGPRVGQRLE
jgi:hypothetical protein